ncbi:WbqC family protein [Pseudomonas citronellolis]|uniref:WbqC family protein n=1 Tax=Pseudomonas citronellolis TaxID=53408 RepID=UPI00209E3555|nr:hypothetical protein [Pseudomonas citronellolis]MCP1655710.1 hypothetical protein [Pseudomonas citronellolis]MCP1722760.1 hypothetical protein [Pseudomonas citronellolis]
MILAVMQPYFFPYLGYYQLAGSVDHFVFLDDVAFIRRGFIHRNNILLDGQPFRFTLPVAGASQNMRIDQHHFVGEHDKFLQVLRHAYRQAPFFDEVFALVESICRMPEQSVASVCAASIQAVFAYLGRPFSVSFASQKPSALRGQERILELCRLFGADTYHNASGGRSLYSAAAFREQHVQLRFVHGCFPAYQQQKVENFMPGLSMIDVLMHNPPQAVERMLSMGELEDAA